MMQINPIIIPAVAEDKYLPRYTHPDDAGADLCAAIDKPFGVFAGKSAHFSTGVRIELPDDIAGFIRSRSGLARKHGVIVLGGGTIDPGYRGEIGITLINLGDTRYTVQPGERIAQLVLVPIIRAKFWQVKKLSESMRGEKGFGSSGKLGQGDDNR